MTRDNSPEPSARNKLTEREAQRASASRFVVLVLLSALSVLPVDVIAPSLPQIAVEFRADVGLINLAVAGYAIVTALVQLISGAISDRYGRRPVALASIAIFIVASVGCVLAPNIAVFLLFRAVQASIAACFSVALVAIKETSSRGDGASIMGYAAMAWAMAPMLGPTFGGAIDELFGWRAIFVVLAMFGAAILLLSVRKLKETASPSSRPKGAYLASYAQLLSSARFWGHILCMAFSMGTFYLFLAGAPLVIGGSSALLGVYMGIVPAGFIFGSYLTSRLANRIPRGTILIVARTLTCIGLLCGLILAAMDMTHALAFFGPCMFIGVGNGLTMPAANMGAMSLRDDLAGTAAGLAAAMSIGGGALVVSIAGLFLNGMASVHALLSVMLAVASLALVAAIFAAFVDRQVAQTPVPSKSLALGRLE